jgi:hypothetical protein
MLHNCAVQTSQFAERFFGGHLGCGWVDLRSHEDGLWVYWFGMLLVEIRLAECLSDRIAN